MTRLEIGDVLEDRYRIDRPIARGGMSTVYRCVDMRLGRAVAAKVMDERYSDDPVFIKRFSREARAMAGRGLLGRGLLSRRRRGGLGDRGVRRLPRHELACGRGAGGSGLRGVRLRSLGLDRRGGGGIVGVV